MTTYLRGLLEKSAFSDVATLIASSESNIFELARLANTDEAGRSLVVSFLDYLYSHPEDHYALPYSMLNVFLSDNLSEQSREFAAKCLVAIGESAMPKLVEMASMMLDLKNRTEQIYALSVRLFELRQNKKEMMDSLLEHSSSLQGTKAAAALNILFRLPVVHHTASTAVATLMDYLERYPRDHPTTPPRHRISALIGLLSFDQKNSLVQYFEFNPMIVYGNAGQSVAACIPESVFRFGKRHEFMERLFPVLYPGDVPRLINAGEADLLLEMIRHAYLHPPEKANDVLNALKYAVICCGQAGLAAIVCSLLEDHNYPFMPHLLKLAKEADTGVLPNSDQIQDYLRKMGRTLEGAEEIHDLSMLLFFNNPSQIGSSAKSSFSGYFTSACETFVSMAVMRGAEKEAVERMICDKFMCASEDFKKQACPADFDRDAFTKRIKQPARHPDGGTYQSGRRLCSG